MRFMIGMFLLNHTYGLSDEQVWDRWVHDPNFQYFTGEDFFQHELRYERSGMSHWRKRIGDRLVILLQESLRIAHCVSTHQLHCMLGVTYKTAWFMAHRIREAMREPIPEPRSMGGPGKIVEADETFVGGKEKNRHKSKRAKTRLGGSWGKETVFSLVERGGKVHSRHTKSVAAKTLRPILVTQLQGDTHLVTDGAGQYRHMGKDFKHSAVNYSADEYVRGEAHTNTIESYFAILKRGIIGVNHQVSAKHLKRYLGGI